MFDTGSTVRRLCAVLCAILALPVVAQETGQSGSIVSIEFIGRDEPNEILEGSRILFEHFVRPDPIHPVDEYELTLWTRDADGTPIRAFASMYIPVVRGVLDAPVLAFASGTTGIGDQCATNLEQPEVVRWGWYRMNMKNYAAQGIITIFPDYVGFHNPDVPQRYFSKLAEGHLLLDALRAVYAFYDERPGLIRSGARPNGVHVTAGYSQGGHAALAAADMVADYAPEIGLSGAIGFAPTNNVEELMRTAAYYAPYIIYSYRSIYGADRVDPAELLHPRWLDTFDEDVPRMCVNDFQYYYPFDGPTMYTEAFEQALREDRLAQEFPAFKQILDENISGITGHGIPVMMIQGNQDIIVTNESQRAFVDRLRSLNTPTSLLELEGVRHRHTRPAGFRASVDFIAQVALPTPYGMAAGRSLSGQH